MRNRVLYGAALAALLVLTGVAPAQARRGDMFDDKGFTIYNRPSVPSDVDYPYTQRSDLFPTNQQYVRPGKDMFDFIRTPPNPGIEQRFSAHRNLVVPWQPMFHRMDEGQ
jgi:hypothetical protein